MQQIHFLFQLPDNILVILECKCCKISSAGMIYSICTSKMDLASYIMKNKSFFQSQHLTHIIQTIKIFESHLEYMETYNTVFELFITNTQW